MTRARRKPQERTEGLTKEGKLPPGTAMAQHRAMERTQRKASVARGWKELGAVERNVYCLEPLHGGVDGLRLPYYRVILSLLLASTLQGNHCFNARSFKTNVPHFFKTNAVWIKTI